MKLPYAIRSRGVAHSGISGQRNRIQSLIELHLDEIAPSAVRRLCADPRSTTAGYRRIGRDSQIVAECVEILDPHAGSCSLDQRPARRRIGDRGDVDGEVLQLLHRLRISLCMKAK